MRMSRERLMAWAEEQIGEISGRLYEEQEATGEDSARTEFQRGRLQGVKHVIHALLGDSDTRLILDAVRKRTDAPIPHVVGISRDGKRYGLDMDAG